MIDWHRLLGLTLTDFFTDSPFVVEMEKDLSLKQQVLDVVILRKQPGEFSGRLPDGLDDLAEHNLLSYKSMREPLDDWILKELAAHYVNYRKQISPSLKKLLPEDQFRLYGISTRFPQKLSEQVRLSPLQAGVYEVVWGTQRIRVIVLSRIPEGDYNSIWHLFSGVQEKVMSGAARYQSHTGEMSTILNQLFDNYQLEGVSMPYTMKDFQRDYIKEHLNVLTPDEVFQRFSTDERLQGLSLEEIKAYLEKSQQKKQKKH
ncbi:MAG: hypothetical protein QME81_15140 [bacterium]|nr:hypothetical protein [bacterium]